VHRRLLGSKFSLQSPHFFELLNQCGLFGERSAKSPIDLGNTALVGSDAIIGIEKAVIERGSHIGGTGLNPGDRYVSVEWILVDECLALWGINLA